NPKKAQEGYLQVFDQGFVTDYPLTIKNKNGNLTDVLYNASVYKDDKGNFLGVFAAARDVTQLNAQNIERERKSIEIANLKVELERTIVCLNESAIVSESDANFNIVFVNDKFCEISGYKREELLGVNHRILKSGKQPDALHMDMMKTIRAGEVFKGNLLNKKKGGKEFYWVEATIMPFKDLDGKLIKCVSIQFDITDQVERKDALIKHAEALRVSEEDLQNINLELEVRSAKDLIASENRFRSLFENATQCMLVVNMKSQKIINANKSAIALFKYSKDDLFKMGPRELSPEWQPDGIASDTQIRADIEKLQKEKKVSREWAFNDAHGDDIQAELSINLLSETDISQVVVNIIDVTEKNRIKDELAYQNEEKDRHAAELAVANKELVFQNEENTKRTAELEEFTYVASHDLQEPVRTISSFVNLFRENYADKLDDEAKQYLDFMDGASQRSQQLIVDLLDYSKLDENRETEQVNLNQVLESVLVDLTGRIKESGALVTVDKLPTIEGQMTNLRLLFQNLISNAIKFHKKDILPKVYISFTTVDNEYVFSISDNGIGIEEKYMDRIFVIFKRLHGKSDYEGTGIGLAHCKKIVELHNGRISVESELEKGSTFLIAIPIEVEI
ncbi:MAG: PAS domain S-box-containing protein, partial [Bacteroidia bacterium]